MKQKAAGVAGTVKRNVGRRKKSVCPFLVLILFIGALFFFPVMRQSVAKCGEKTAEWAENSEEKKGENAVSSFTESSAQSFFFSFPDERVLLLEE